MDFFFVDFAGDKFNEDPIKMNEISPQQQFPWRGLHTVTDNTIRFLKPYKIRI